MKLLFLVLLTLMFLGCDEVDNEDSENTSLIALPALSTITDSSGNIYQVGYDQVTAINQDPYVLKTSASGSEIWRIRHDETPIDARAVLVALDSQNRPYVIFTADGGSNDSKRYQTNHANPDAFGEAPFKSYGSGGGPKVSIIARLNPETGRIEKGTFLLARLTSGNTNTLNISGLAVSDSSVEVDVTSAAWPPGPGASSSSWMRFNEALFNDSSRPPLRYTLDLNLTQISSVVVIE